MKGTTTGVGCFFGSKPFDSKFMCLSLICKSTDLKYDAVTGGECARDMRVSSVDSLSNPGTSQRVGSWERASFMLIEERCCYR